MRFILNFLSFAWCVYMVRTGYSYALEITDEWQEGLRPNTVLLTAWFVVVFFGSLAIANFLNFYESLTKSKDRGI